MTRLFDDLAEGLGEALAHAEGRSPTTRLRVIRISRNEVRETRLRTGLTQREFAAMMGAGLDTVRKWEQGTRRPSGAAARLLRIVAHRPTIIHEVFGADHVEAAE